MRDDRCPSAIFSICERVKSSICTSISTRHRYEVVDGAMMMKSKGILQLECCDETNIMVLSFLEFYAVTLSYFARSLSRSFARGSNVNICSQECAPISIA